MPFILILIGAALLIAAVRNTQGDLANALASDVPPFLKWALALVGVSALGWIPGVKIPDRYLLALVIVVIVLTNYRQILAGFTSLSTSPPVASTAAPTPGAVVGTTPGAAVTGAEISGTGTVPANASATAVGKVSSLMSFEPQQFLTAFEQGAGGSGFGGVA